MVAFANGGGDMVTAIKQANEFGLTKSLTMAALLVTYLGRAQHAASGRAGAEFVTAFYWDRNDETRAWSKRFFERQHSMPTMAQASAYSAVRHYLAAIAAAGTDEAKAVMAKMREMPVNDFYAHDGHLREDGRLVHDMYFEQVKTPAEFQGSVGLRQDPCHHPRRPGVPPDGRSRLSAGRGALR